MSSAASRSATDASDQAGLAPPPGDWPKLPLFSVAQEARRSNKGLAETNLLSLSYGEIVRKSIDASDGLLPESFETYQIIEKDDIVCRFTDLQNDKRSLRTAKSPERGIITSAYVVATPTRVDPRFLAYLMRSYDTQKVFYGMGGGIRQSLRWDDVKKIEIAVPPSDVQRAIADYLDRETTQIDALIEKQGELAALLQERNKTVVAHAVTKGLNQGTSTTETRLEWLGPIPSHWEMVRFGHIFRESKETNGAQPVGPMLSVSGLRGIEVKEYEADSQMRTDEMLEDYRVVRPGQLVVNTMWLNHAGLGISELTGHVSPAYRSYSPIRKFHAPYLHHLLRSSSYVSGYSSCLRGIRPNSLQMDRDTLMKWPILLPPLDEQRAIAAFVEQETSKMNSLAAKARSFIEIARERRAALITAAVTGQIDVQEKING